MSEAERIEIESITTPGHIQRVDRAKYLAMRHALLQTLLLQFLQRSARMTCLQQLDHLVKQA